MSVVLDLRASLGLPANADEKTIARSYRRKVRSLHPDTNPDPAAATELAALNAAYAAHNRGDSTAPQAPAAAAPETAAESTLQIVPSPGAGRGDTIMARVHLPEPVGPGGREYTLSARQGQACGPCRGTGTDLASTRVRCPKCDGLRMNPLTGVPCVECAGLGERGSARCPVCDGARVLEHVHEVTVCLPEGAGGEGFARHPYPRHGFPSPTGGQPGDLVVTVTVDTQPERPAAATTGGPGTAPPTGAGPTFLPSPAGAGLVVPLSYAELRCGTTIDVPTPTGALAPLVVPAGTAPGAVLELPGHGGPISTGGSGTLFVRCDLVWLGPAGVGDRAALEALERAEQSGRPPLRSSWS